MLHEAIETQLKALKFRGMLAHFDELIKEKNESALELLLTLLKRETAYRQARSLMYRLTVAKLPVLKSLNHFDPVGLPINHDVLAKAKELAFIKNHSNALIIGGAGSGKTHLAIGLAQAALNSHYRLRFYKLIDLARELAMAAVHHQESKLLAKLKRFDLLVIDEFGYLPIDPKASPLLFELFSDLYEHVSIIITTYLTFTEWSDIFGNAKMTKTMIDRFTHHCLILETGNKSWRLKENQLQNTQA